MKRILVFLLVLSIFITPVYAQSAAEKGFWDSLGMNPPDTTESSSDRYLAGYQDGYNAGYQAGFAFGLEQASNQAPAPTISQTEPELKEKTAPANGKILLYPDKERVVPLTIHTSGDDYYCFILTELGSSERYMAVFGHGGKTVDVDVPIGAYLIYYATGKTWYGLDDLFGPDTSYYRCSNFFPFKKEHDTYKGWELTLYPVADGNMDSETISADDFPK